MSYNAKTMVDEDFDELARSLRDGIGRELRAEAAEDELLTELQRRRHRRLADVARTALQRGDDVTVEVAGLRLGYPAVAVAADYLTLDGGESQIDVRLAAGVMRVVPSRSGGRSAHRPAAETFRARLGELEQQAADVEVVTANGVRATGRIEVLATDHLVVAGDEGAVTYLPIDLVSVVFSRNPPRRM